MFFLGSFLFVLCFFLKVFFHFFSLEQHLTAKKSEGRWGTGGGEYHIYMYICIYVDYTWVIEGSEKGLYIHMYIYTNMYIYIWTTLES